MTEEAEDAVPRETGGLLLGYIAPASTPEEVLIEDVLGPGPGAEHTTRSFVPDSAWQQEQLAAAYEGSGRITTYLGDWHTHPRGVPAPSRRDRRTARVIARLRTSRLPRPLMLILASDADGKWTLVVYRWQGRRLEPVDVEVLDRQQY